MAEMRFHSVVVAYTVWLVALFGVYFVLHGVSAESSLQVVLMAGAIPVGLQLLLLGIDWRGLVAPVRMWLALLLIILVSYLANVTDPQTAPRPVAGLGIPASWVPIVYTLNVVFILGIGTAIAGCPDRRLLRSIASLFCVLFAPFLLYVDVAGERTWGNRLNANDIESNMWGLMGLTLCLTAFARQMGPVAITGFAIGAETILAASSREHLVAVAVVLLIVVALNFRTINRPRLFVLLGASCSILLVVALFLPYVSEAIGYVGSDVFLLNDPLRGVDSGFTGRSDIWAETGGLWLKHPLLGIGFRQHEQFLAGTPAHNAYLAMLADTGLLGFVWFVALLIASLLASLGIRDQRTRRLVTTFVAANIVIGFFDRRTINGGNPYSLLFIMCCSVALADQSLRRVARALQAPFDVARGARSRTEPLLPAR